MKGSFFFNFTTQKPTSKRHYQHDRHIISLRFLGTGHKQNNNRWGLVCCPPIQSRPPYYFLLPPPSYPDREASLFITLPGLLCLYACMRYIIQPQLPPTICFGEEGCLLFVHPTLSPVVVVFRLFWSVRVTGLKVFYSRPPYAYSMPAYYCILFHYYSF